MIEGNVADATPSNAATEPSPSDNIGGQNGEAAPEAKPNLDVELARLAEKYSASSTEGKRLAAENKQLQERLAALEQRSLKSENTSATQNPYENEDAYIQFWTAKGYKTEDEARLEAREKKIIWDNQQNLYQMVQAVANRQRFDSELQEKAYIENSPEAKKAIEFCKAIPELNTLATIDKVARYREAMNAMSIKPDGVDKTAVKMAAGGASGNAPNRHNEAQDPKLDSMAREAGFPSWKAMMDMRSAKTPTEYAALKQKYKIK